MYSPHSERFSETIIFDSVLFLVLFYSIKDSVKHILHVLSNNYVVLVLAGIKFIFFIVAGMGLCFGFVLKTVLITPGCFRYC